MRETLIENDIHVIPLHSGFRACGSLYVRYFLRLKLVDFHVSTDLPLSNVLLLARFILLFANEFSQVCPMALISYPSRQTWPDHWTEV
jgi:hypothetical protein